MVNHITEIADKVTTIKETCQAGTVVLTDLKSTTLEQESNLYLHSFLHS